MWNWLWLLPSVLLLWALVLVVRKVRHAGKKAEVEPPTLEERLAALEEEDGDDAARS